MKKIDNVRANKSTKTLFSIASAIICIAVLFLVLINFSSALPNSNYLQTDKDIYVIGDMVTIYINGQTNAFMEIETPSAKYSLSGETESSQKFLPSEIGNYKIILLDSENILETKSFSVVSEENYNVNNNENSNDNNLLIANKSANNENSSLDIMINNISALITSITNLNNSINNTMPRKNGDLLISTDKKVYAKNEIVSIFLLTNKKIGQIKITSESAEYLLLTDGENTSEEILNKKLSFIPDKVGGYIVSLKPIDENVYYDIFFYVQEDNIVSGYQNISENITNSLYKIYGGIYEGINGIQGAHENISERNSQIMQNISVNNIIKKDKINVVNSKGEKNKIGLSFYKAQNLTGQQLAEPNIQNSKFKNDVVISGDNILQFDKYDVEVIPDNSSVKKLDLKDFVYMDNANIGIENIPSEKYKKEKSPERKVIDSYAINLENVSFSEATATITAKGNELWKCAEWNFTEQVCSGSWVKMQDLSPGHDYNILLYKGDPGYIEILVSKAAHFNANGTFVLDVFDAIKTLDNIWTESIYAGEFLRVTFEKNLTSQNDITIYARSNESANLEVYEKDSDIKIADFGPISAYKKYQILLTNLTESQDTFDLRVVNNENDSSAFLEFDYIIDPYSTYNSTVGAPVCSDSTSPCIAVSSLLQCAGAQTTPGPEPNYPNSIDACTDDSTVGTCHSDESVENITINDLNDSTFVQGDTINVNATFYCYGATDRVAIYYTNSTSTINWQNKLVGTTTCSGAGYLSYNASFKMDNVSGFHAVRAIMLYNANIGSACPTGTYRDQDDLVFKVSALGEDNPPVVSLAYPADNYFNNTNKFVNLTFNATVSDDKKIVNCSLWTNYSGSWALNQTQSVSGISNITEFNLINLNNKTFIWNIQCYDNASNSSWGSDNWTVILKMEADASGYFERFSNLQSTDFDVIALDNNTVVIAWVDNATGYNISFQVMNTNGDIITSKTLVDATGGNTSRVTLAPINATAFVLGIFDQPQNNIDFFVFDRTGSSIVGRTNAAATVGANTDARVCELGDRIPVAYSRTSNGDAELRIFYNNGTMGTGTTQIDTNMAPELPNQNLVSCSAINSTAFVYAWFDDNSNYATFTVRSNTGTSIVAATQYDTNVGETAQIATSSLGNNMFTTAFYDSTDDDITINVTRITGATATSVYSGDIDTNAGTDSRVDVATIQMLNTPDFAVAWIDTSDNTIKAAVYNQTGSQVAAPFNVSTTPNATFPMVKVAGYEPVLQKGLCNGTFVVAYTNRTGGSLINKYWYNGTPWDGVCPDYVPPVVNLNNPANDSNITNNYVSFNFTASDDVSIVLKNCSLWANFTGSWQRNNTVYDIVAGAKTNITMAGLNDGLYIWNVQCYDNASNGAFAMANYTLRINYNTPLLQNARINATTINQSIKIKFNVTITDFFGIKSAIVTLRYPNATQINYTLIKSGNEYYYNFTNTIQLGTYDIVYIWAEDNLGQVNYNASPNLEFNVTPSPPTAFNLISPANNTVSQQLIPTFSWQQTTEANFSNYTILVTKDSTFDTIDFTYATYLITNTTFLSTYALDSNTNYYWKVQANDVFGNQKNSTQEFTYITDTAAPSITLNMPANSSYWTTTNVQFNYTPTDANSLQSCILYGNFTGVFARNQTNMSIINNDYNYFNLNLGEGIYLWTIYCNDSALNGKFASVNNTFFLDLSGPVINLTSPANNAKENTTNNVVFKVNASDKYANISSCSLIVNNSIERTKDTIDNNVEFNFTNFELNGNYTWSVNCTDTNGFTTASATRNLTVLVIDNNPPLVTLNFPVDDYVSYNNITFNYTPEDATGIKNCSLYIDGIYNQSNTTMIRNFEDNFFNVSRINDGNHTWRVICYDNSTGLNQGLSNIRTFYVDTINPSVILHYPGNAMTNNDWYYSTYQYRIKHKINASSSGTLINYSINIIVHYGAGTNTGNEVYLNSHSKTDFGDIRFANENNSAALGYYMENKTDANIASFWVMVPSIDSVNGTNIFIYYGNSGAATTSNGSNAFDFFDDFSDGLGKWTIDPENTDAIIINSSLGNPNPGLVHLPDSSQTKNAYYDTRMRTKDYKITDGIIDYDLYISGTSRAIHQFGWRVNDITFTSGYAWRLQTNAADGGFFEFAGGTWTALGTAYPAVSAGNWYHVTINVSSSNYNASVNPGSATSVSDNTKTTGDYLTSHVHATGTDYYVLLDNVRVRKFASSAPVDSTWYTEETRSEILPEYVTSSTVLFNYTPQDTNLANCSLYGNFSGAFTKDQTNLTPVSNIENFFTKILDDGVYVWNVECFDLSQRSAFASANYTFKVDTTNPVYSNIVINPQNLSAYNASQIYSFNITWTDNFNLSYVIIEENFSGAYRNTTLTPASGVYSFSTSNLSAGIYYYKWYAQDAAGNKNETEVYNYEVVKANSTIALSLNGLQNNVTVNETTAVNINASLLIPAAGNLDLYIDGNLIMTGLSPLLNTTTMSEPGTHNVTAVYLGTQNYSASQNTHFILVNDTTPPFIQLISPKNNGYIGTGSATLQYNVTDKSSISSCSLYVNALLNQTNTTVDKDTTQFFIVNLVIANYNWSVSCTDNNSNMNTTPTRNFSAVDINTVKIYVNTTKPQYEKGELALIETNTKDIYDNAMVTNVTTQIIRGITATPWWNASWKFRKQIFVNNTVNRNRTETIDLNITGLDNNITSCNELRIVKNTTLLGMTIHELLPAEVISGSTTWCIVRFNLELNANSTNQGNLFVYYGNSTVSGQGATVDRIGTWVQRGVAAGTLATLTATINSVNMAHTLVLHTQSSTSSAPTLLQYTSTMTVPTEITFEKYGTGTVGNVSWQAIESSDINVQRNNMSFAAATATVNIPITAVNLSRAFIIVNGRVNSATTSTYNQGTFNARFLNSTTIQLDRRTTGTAAMAGWQVVEWNNSRVQAGNVSFTGTLQNVAVSSVNLSRAMLFFGSSVSGGTGVGSNFIMGNITSPTQITFERTYNVGTVNVTWFLVELPEEFVVQNDSISMNTDQSIALDEVDYNKAFHTQSWSSTGTTAITYVNTLILVNLTSPINIMLNKQTATYTHIVRLFTADTYTGTKWFGAQQELIQQTSSQTDLLGYFPVTQNTSNLSYDNYTAISAATKQNFVNETKYTIFEVIHDKTAPNVTLETPNDFIERGVGYLNFSFTPYDINLKNCSLYVNTNGTFNILAINNSPANNQTMNFINIYIDLGLQAWNIGCRDEEGNLGFAAQNRTLNITGPDLRIRTQDIYFGNEQKIEGTNITIFANITNAGLTNANTSFTVQFFKGDPDSGGLQIGNNLTIANLSFGNTITVNTTKYVLAAGKNNIYVLVDTANTINETYESNNKANNNVSVALYQYYFGNISRKIITASSDGFAFIDFENTTPKTGVLLFADEDSSFSFADLQALTRNKNNQLVGDDFSNLDTAMNTTTFDDSIKTKWGGGTDVPIYTTDFNLSNRTIQNVPIANSTNSSDFVTGILWDTTDDLGNLQYDATDKEDVVFITNVNPQKIGAYGLYDTEIKIPATLRNYKSGNDKVVFYVEIK